MPKNHTPEMWPKCECDVVGMALMKFIMMDAKTIKSICSD